MLRTEEPIRTCERMLSALRSSPQNLYELSIATGLQDSVLSPYAAELLAREWLEVIPESLDLERKTSLDDALREVARDVMLERIRLSAEQGIVEGTQRWYALFQERQEDLPAMFMALTYEGIIALKKIEGLHR